MEDCQHCGEEGGSFRSYFAKSLCDECFVGHCDGESQRRQEGDYWDE